jgi:hypothetical protein
MLVAAAGIVAGALLIATPALGLRAMVFGEEPTPTWTWPEGIPGEPIQAPRILRDFNDELQGKWLRNRVDIDTTRLIVTVGSGNDSSPS